MRRLITQSLLAATLLILSLTTASSQIAISESITQYGAERVGESDGFLQNTVVDIIQDERGFLWCSTPNGLYRYDGYDFNIFYNDPKSEQSLESSAIHSTKRWFDGKLCFASNTALNIYNPEENTFHRIKIPRISSNDKFRGFEVDLSRRGVVWLLYQQRILVLQLSEDLREVEQILVDQPNHDDSRARTPYRRIVSDHNGYIWLLSANTVSCNLTLSEHNINQIYRYRAFNAREMMVDRSGQLILYSDGMLTIISHNPFYDDFDSEDIDISKSGITLHNICLTPDGQCIGVEWGRAIHRIGISSREIISTPLESLGSIGREFSYRCSYVDRSGVLWVGTLHGGLYKVNLMSKPFLNSSAVTRDTYPNQITGDRRGNIFVGTFYNGISHFNTKSGRSNSSQINKALGLNKRTPIFAVEHNRDYLWYATREGVISRGVTRVDGSIASHTEVAHVAAGLGFFYFTKSGRLYYAIFNPAGEETLYFCDNANASSPEFQVVKEVSGAESRGVSSLLELSSGELLVGTTSQGLYSYTPSPSGVESASKRIPLPDEINHRAIFALYEDFQGKLYVGSFGGGLLVTSLEGDLAQREYAHYTRKDGLANNAIYAIQGGRMNYIWISTDEGISRFNLLDHKFRNYDTSDGVLSLNFRKWSSWRSYDGELFFGGTAGVNHFTPESITTNAYLPLLEIIDFKAGGESLPFLPYLFKCNGDEESHPKAQELRLEPYQNSLTFSFASLHFDNPKKNSYEYMLRGVDHKWRRASASSRSVTYSALSAGSYTFLVRGTNSDGVWSSEYSAIKIYIPPYWWGSIYAKWIYAILFVVLLVLIYQYIIQRHKHLLDNQLNQAKLDFFTNISHEIKTPLTIISGALECGAEGSISPRDVEIIRRNNNRMLSLVGQLLDFRKITQGHAPFRPSVGNIVPLIESISESFELLSLKSNIAYRYTSTESSRELCFEADKVEKIVANLLSNAFKHTPKESGQIELRLMAGCPATLPSRIKRKISYPNLYYTTISVSDNGEGIAAEYLTKIFDQFYQVGESDPQQKSRGVGVGLAYSRVLTELHEGYIYAESEVGRGSTFYVILPQELQSTKAEESREIPAHEVEFIVEQRESTPRYAEVTPSEREILIVEDNHEIRELLHRLLSPLYTIHEAENGVQGLEVALRVIPDLVISDVMMPEMDGTTLCEHLKSSDKTNHIPVILLTAASSMEHRVEGLRSGADSYIAKPFSAEHLMVRIEKLLEIRSLLKSKYMQLSGLTALEDIEICDPDKEFLQQVEEAIERNLEDSEFTAGRLEQELNYTHIQLYRKIKGITGISVVEFIRNYRLKRSVDMMRKGGLRINEIMYSVGFATPSYYSKSFKKRYGKSPAEFMEELRNS